MKGEKNLGTMNVGGYYIFIKHLVTRLGREKVAPKRNYVPNRRITGYQEKEYGGSQ